MPNQKRLWINLPVKFTTPRNYQILVYFQGIIFKTFFSASDIMLLTGCPNLGNNLECKSSFGGFQGCMQLISIGNEAVDMISVQQNIFGNFSDLQIDLCGIMDR